MGSNTSIIRTAVLAAIEWHEEAPIEELEAVEDAIQRRFPIIELKEALEHLREPLSHKQF